MCSPQQQSLRPSKVSEEGAPSSPPSGEENTSLLLKEKKNPWFLFFFSSKNTFSFQSHSLGSCLKRCIIFCSIHANKTIIHVASDAAEAPLGMDVIPGKGVGGKHILGRKTCSCPASQTNPRRLATPARPPAGVGSRVTQEVWLPLQAWLPGGGGSRAPLRIVTSGLGGSPQCKALHRGSSSWAFLRKGSENVARFPKNLPESPGDLSLHHSMQMIKQKMKANHQERQEPFLFPTPATPTHFATAS